jgi:type III pantothenate kinase
MRTPLLAVGVGNTTVKFGLTLSPDDAEWPEWLQLREVPTAEFDPASLSLMLGHSPVHWHVASVHRPAEQGLREWVQRQRPEDSYRRLSHQNLAIRLNVDAPERVGLDRLAAAVAANRLRDPSRPAIVIDAGTALTVNLVTADGTFQGGVILPGFSLTARALQMGTDQLPLVVADLNQDPPRVVGKSTEEAIRSGLFWGNVGAVREIVHRVQTDLDQQPHVFVTGGDARRLAGFVAEDARFVPDLVLAGIVFTATSGRSNMP